MQLDRFKKAKEEEVATLRIRAEKEGFKAYEQARPDFLHALQKSSPLLPVIAEYKRASPSKGLICDTLSVEEAARQYVHSGARCLSILTEERYFQGSLSFLSRAQAACLPVAVPLLRKDFLFDPLQIEATAETPAAALLLIVGLTPEVHLLRVLREMAEGYGMQAVVEIFSPKELMLARESGARIIQVNARNLESFTVDKNAVLSLARNNRPESHEVWIAASGLTDADDLKAAREAGFSAALIGTHLMQGGEPGRALAALLGESHVY